jgi:hypothetical protein
MQRVHLDTDLGGDIDDLRALALLLKGSDVEITGITTVAEENGRRAGCKGNIVAAGVDVSSGAYRFKPGYPDEVRYCDATIPPAPGDPDVALQLLEASIEQGAHIIGIGPYTNLARCEDYTFAAAPVHSRRLVARANFRRWQNNIGRVTDRWRVSTGTG